jgi:DNA-binding IclR family transcriptional regulator
VEQRDEPGQRDGAKEVLSVVAALIDRTQPGWGVRELAEELDSSRSTVNRILARLAEERLAAREPSGTYTVGARLRVLSNALQERHPLFSEGAPILARLSRETGATALMAVESVDPTECFVLISHEPDAPVRYSLPPGTRLPTHAGALGLAILSRRGTQGLPQELPAYTDDSIQTRARIEEAIASSSSLGAVVSVGQHIPDAAGVAVPVMLGRGAIGSISISRPRIEFREADIAPSAALLRAAARDLETHLLMAPAPRPSARVPGTPSSGLVERISRLLTVLCADPLAEITLKQLSTLTGARSVASRRLAEAACEYGLMSKPQGHRWAIGPALLNWSASLGSRIDIADMADEGLRTLSEETGETVSLTLYDAPSARAHVATTRSGTNTVRYVMEAGTAVRLDEAAAGKAILAFLPRPEPTRPGQAPGIEGELERVRSLGWATDEHDPLPEGCGIAAPFFMDGAVRGSVTVTVPRHRLTATTVSKLAPDVSRAAASITALLTVRDAKGQVGRSPGAAADSSRLLPLAGL